MDTSSPMAKSAPGEKQAEKTRHMGEAQTRIRN
jgi:hypothetical protein